MSQLPPNVPGCATPYKLLNADEVVILQEHYRLVRKCRTAEEREKALRGWDERQVRVVKGLYERLRFNGFVVDGQHESGTLFFRTIAKSAVQQIMDLSDDDFKLYRQGKLAFDHGVLRRVGC